MTCELLMARWVRSASLFGVNERKCICWLLWNSIILYIKGTSFEEYLNLILCNGLILSLCLLYAAWHIHDITEHIQLTLLRLALITFSHLWGFQDLKHPGSVPVLFTAENLCDSGPVPNNDYVCYSLYRRMLNICDILN